MSNAGVLGDVVDRLSGLVRGVFGRFLGHPAAAQPQASSGPGPDDPIPAGTDAKPGDPGYQVPRASGDQVPLNTAPGAANDPDVDTSDDETGWETNVPAANNPPGYTPTPPGSTRDLNWIDYLGGRNGDGSTAPAGQIPAAYPNPDAVYSRHLKLIGAAELQQGTRYVWGGGTDQGTTLGESDGSATGDAEVYHDEDYHGFDCSGLVQYCYYQTTGDAEFPKGSGQQYQYLLANGGQIVAQQSAAGTPVPPTNLQPGDLIYYGQTGWTHVAIYVGNGVTVETNQSGTPAHSQLAALNASGDDSPITVIRPPS